MQKLNCTEIKRKRKLVVDQKVKTSSAHDRRRGVREMPWGIDRPPQRREQHHAARRDVPR